MEMTIEQRNDFIEKNSGLIGKWAQHYVKSAARKGYTYNDCFNQGVLGMIKGIKRYDLKKATKENGDIVPLEAFVNDDIRKAIGKDFALKARHVDKDENKISMQHTTTSSVGESVTLEDMIPDENASADAGQAKDMIKELAKKCLEFDFLSNTEKAVMRLLYIEGKGHREVEAIMRKVTGKSTFQAFYHRDRAIEKIKQHFSRNMGIESFQDIM